MGRLFINMLSFVLEIIGGVVVLKILFVITGISTGCITVGEDSPIFLGNYCMSEYNGKGAYVPKGKE